MIINISSSTNNYLYVQYVLPPVFSNPQRPTQLVSLKPEVDNDKYDDDDNVQYDEYDDENVANDNDDEYGDSNDSDDEYGDEGYDDDCDDEDDDDDDDVDGDDDSDYNTLMLAYVKE